MAKVKIKNVEKVIKQTKKLFKDITTSKRLTKEIGNFSVDRIKQAARAGYSLSNNVSRQKFPKLSKFTKDLRKAIKDTDPSIVDDLMRPGKANVTLTGQLVDSIDYKIKGNKIFVTIDGKRTKINFEDLAKKARRKFGYKDKRARILAVMAYGFEDNQKNNNVSVYRNLKKLGYEFLGMDEKGQDRIVQLVLREFRRQIKLKS